MFKECELYNNFNVSKQLPCNYLLLELYEKFIKSKQKETKLTQEFTLLQ